MRASADTRLGREDATEVPAAAGILEAAGYLYRKKLLLAIGVLLASGIGALIAFLSPPVYKASAVIAPKEAKGAPGGNAIFSQLGGLGGMVASQLGIGDNNLNRLEVILKSPQLAESVITAHDLLPKLFPDEWDETSRSWKGENGRPTLLRAVRRLRSGILFVSLDEKRKVMSITARTRSPRFSADLVRHYLDALNLRIKEDVRSDADSNRKYLEAQSANVFDPLLREKIQSLIGIEVEKSMLVSSRAFDILEGPIVPDVRDAPNRKLILLLAALTGILLSGTGLLAMRTLSEMGIRRETNGKNGEER